MTKLRIGSLITVGIALGICLQTLLSPQIPQSLESRRQWFQVGYERGWRDGKNFPNDLQIREAHLNDSMNFDLEFPKDPPKNKKPIMTDTGRRSVRIIAKPPQAPIDGSHGGLLPDRTKADSLLRDRRP